MDDAGVIENIEDKFTKAGKPYKSYRISGQYYNDFHSMQTDVQVGDRVDFSYSSKGQYKNLEEVSKLPAGVGGENAQSDTALEGQGKVASFPSPDFFEMCANQAVELSIANGPLNNETLEKNFDKVWDLWTKKKKEKNAQ